MSDYIERYWRDATPEDAIAEPPMVARFRNSEKHDWRIDPLIGIRRDHNYPWHTVNLGSYSHCQVYDAPDPGEGWRLVDEPQVGDEVLVDIGDPDDWKPHTKWEPISGNVGKQCIVRRRIEQPKPEPRYEPFTWEDREQLRGRWIGSNDGLWERLVANFWSSKTSEYFYINGFLAESLCAQWHFLDTGEPVGRRVE